MINYLRKESNAGKPQEQEKKEEKEKEKGKSAKKGVAATKAAKNAGKEQAIAEEPEAVDLPTIPYELWLDVVNGKYRHEVAKE